LFISSAGRVGVGAESTSFPFTVFNTSGDSSAALIGANTGNCDLLFGDVASSFSGRIRYAHSTDSFQFFTSSAERLRITSAGLVGIGTSVPKAKLDCSLSSSGELAFFGGQISTNSGSYAGIAFGYSTNGTLAYSKSAIVQEQIGDASAAGKIHILNNNTVGGANAGLADARLTITPAGNVGIGNTAPSAPLTVVGANSDGVTVILDSGSAPNPVIISNSSSSSTLRIKGGNSTAIGRAGGQIDLVGGLAAADAGTIKFRTGTATGEQLEKARLTSSGQLLVGTSSWTGSAAAVFSGSSGGTGSGTVYIGRGSVNLANNQPQGFIRFTDADENEFANIGCSTDATGATGTDTPGRLSFSTTPSGAASPVEWMRINNLGLTTIYAATGAAATGPLTASTFYSGQNGSRRIIIGKHSATSVGDGTVCFYVDDRGNVANTNNSYTAISDIKLKENIVGAKSQWDDIKALRVVNYNFKPETNFGTHTQIGLIAQEVEPVSPNLVNESPDVDENGIETGTVTKSVNYSVLYMKAVKALQEAMERIETLEAAVTALQQS
jgi:hypothetical protein